MTSAHLSFSERDVVLLDAAMNTYIQVLRCYQWREPTVVDELYGLKARLERLVQQENAVS